ncbi:hypothetical protein Q1695_005301 [Nippostrongylus brasiliensis]|nr:hypothetical protein Q1695_005301 [Nippostrongylus brasiliensis]
MSFVSSMMIVADSFLYRYLLVCRVQLFESYMTKRNVLLAVVANLLIISIWMICAVYIILWPSAQFIESCSSMVALDAGLNSSECALLGVSFKANKLPLFVIINVSLTIIAIIMAYAALEINATLRKSTISGNVRKLHRRMLTMLLLQAACPILLLHTPLFVAFVYLIAGWSAPLKVSYTITILRTLFPLPNPIITIAFVSEYRVYTLSKLKLL